MSNKMILIFGGILGLVILVVIIVSFAAGGNTKDKISVEGKNNVNVKVEDFLKNNKLNFQDVAIISEGDFFVTQYDKNNKTFQMLLNIVSKEQLNEVRQKAEKALLDKLGVSETELCTLNVVETVPDNGLVTLPVYNFPPSFCPYSIKSF
jgi:hypothetical protein